MATKEVEELVEAIEANGFEVEWDGGGHGKVKYQGQTVRENVGTDTEPVMGPPIMLPSTPSDSRWYDSTVATLVRSHVLDVDPKKAGQRGLTDEQRQEREDAREERDVKRERAERAADANRELARKRQADTTVVRARFERIFGPLNTWKRTGTRGGKTGSRGTITEIARVAHAWADRAGVAHPSRGGAEQNIRFLYDGNSVSEQNLAFWRAFADELEKSPNPAARYNDLLRQTLGVGEQAEPVPHTRQPREEAPEEDEELDAELSDLRQQLAALETDKEALESQVGEARAVIRQLEASTSANGAQVPELAFECLAEMLGQLVTVGGEDAGHLEGIMEMLDAKKERVVDLAKRVAQVELGISE